MERKEFGTLNTDKNDAVFVALTADYILPYMYGKQAGQTIEVVLMQLRWDGRIGFPGGKVDNDERLEEAVIREAWEEVGADLDEETLVPVCTHEFQAGDKTLTTHLFKRKVSLDYLHCLITETVNATDFGGENCGNVLVHLENYGKKGFDNFMKNNFASSVREELYILGKEINPSLESQELNKSFSNKALYLK